MGRVARRLKPSDRAAAAESIRRLLQEIERGDLEAADVERAYLEGALRGLEGRREY